MHRAIGLPAANDGGVGDLDLQRCASKSTESRRASRNLHGPTRLNDSSSRALPTLESLVVSDDQDCFAFLSSLPLFQQPTGEALLKSELLRAIQIEISRHSFGTFRIDIGISVRGCPTCREQFDTISGYNDHINHDVLPALVDRLFDNSEIPIK